MTIREKAKLFGQETSIRDSTKDLIGHLQTKGAMGQQTEHMISSRFSPHISTKVLLHLYTFESGYLAGVLCLWIYSKHIQGITLSVGIMVKHSHKFLGVGGFIAPSSRWPFGGASSPFGEG